MSNPQQLCLEFDRLPNVSPQRNGSSAPKKPLPVIGHSSPAPVQRTSEKPLPAIRSASPASAQPQNNAEPKAAQFNPEGFLLRPPADKNGKLLPIPYGIKVSASARRVYLRVEPGRGLQITIPKRYPKRTLPELVESQRKWVTEALEDLDNKTPPLYRHWPPSQLNLQACSTMVNLQYVARTAAINPDKACAKWLSSSELQLDVDTKNKPLVAKVISQALKGRARDELGPWLDARSKAADLPFKKMSVRGQRTVWGTYSSNGTLSLNYKLLFLEPNLVDYVLLHEIAHIKHLDHSPAFWRFLEGLKPHARQLDDELQEAGTQVPPWLELAAA